MPNGMLAACINGSSSSDLILAVKRPELGSARSSLRGDHKSDRRKSLDR